MSSKFFQINRRRFRGRKLRDFKKRRRGKAPSIFKRMKSMVKNEYGKLVEKKIVDVLATGNIQANSTWYIRTGLCTNITVGDSDYGNREGDKVILDKFNFNLKVTGDITSVGSGHLIYRVIAIQWKVDGVPVAGDILQSPVNGITTPFTQDRVKADQFNILFDKTYTSTAFSGGVIVDSKLINPTARQVTYTGGTTTVLKNDIYILSFAQYTNQINPIQSTFYCRLMYHE